MSTYRCVVCSEKFDNNKEKVIVDFAIADEGKAKLTHQQLIDLRKYETPKAEPLLPPIVIDKNKETISVFFEKPDRATDDDNKKLKELTSQIKCELNRMIDRGKESTIEKNIKNAHVGIQNPYASAKSKEAEENLKNAQLAKRREARLLGAKLPSPWKNYLRSE